MRVAVTGGAGFIGSNLVDVLLGQGHEVMAIDNLSTGRPEFLESANAQQGFTFVRLDLLDDADRLPSLLDGFEAVFHLAANADVRFGWSSPARDLEQNVVVTHGLLEAARIASVPHFVFASTGSVYGEATMIPTPEDAPFPLQTSLYGASKAAAEAFLQAYGGGTGMKGTIFRFVSVLGPRYTHGHVIDFVRALRRDPSRLVVLGDGRQRKSYMDVTDCVRAVAGAVEQESGLEVYNLGVDGYCTVTESAGWICARMGVAPALEYTGGSRGWVGDNPFIFLDASRARAAGWKPTYTIREAVDRTVDYLLANESLLDDTELRS